MKTSHRLALLALLAAVVTPSLLWAQPAPAPIKPNPLAPVLKPIQPVGMQRGTSLEITLTGTNLAGPTGVLASFPAKVTIPTDANNGKEETKLRIHLEVPADAPLGFYTLRLATTRGMSNFRMFCIDDLPQVLEVATNHAKNMAQEVTPPCVVVGKADAELSDYFKIKAAAGQRLSFEVLGRRLGSAFDPQITLYNARTGLELPDGHSNDGPGLQTDPRLTYVFKEAGEYLVEIRDVSYRGGEDYVYRLRIGDFPCATTPLPLAVKRGSKVAVQFAGPGVEGVAPVEVQAPTEPGVDVLQVAPHGANGLHGWPVSLLLSDLDEALEQEPNNEQAKANRIPVPGAVSARFQDKGDVDYFVFAAKKGQRYILEAQTSELHSPSEVFLMLRDAKGGQLKASDPMAAPRIDYTATADGDLLVSAEHLHYWGGPAESYRLTVVPYEQDFDLSVGIDRYDASQGGTVAIPILAVRRDYTGPIEVSVVGPMGVEGKVTIPTGKPAAPNQPAAVLVVNVGDVPMGPLTFAIQGKADIAGKAVTRLASVRTVVSTEMGGLPVPPRPLWTSLALAVTERAPFTLAAKFDMASAAPGKPAPLTITVTRVAGFGAEIALTAGGLPANVTAALKNVPASMDEAKGQLNLAANAAVGEFPIVITGKVKHQGKDFTVNSLPVTLVIKK
jgi:hypothetical protein